MTSPRLATAAARALALSSLVGLVSACSSPYYSDPRGRFHMQTPMTMNVSGTTKVVTLEPGNGTSVRIDSVDSEADLTAYLDTRIDRAALGHGDIEDHTFAGLDARRLEFRGGIELGDGLPMLVNVSLYLIQDGTQVYRIACTGPDGPFEQFCLGPFDDMVLTFALGAAP